MLFFCHITRKMLGIFCAQIKNNVCYCLKKSFLLQLFSRRGKKFLILNKKRKDHNKKWFWEISISMQMRLYFSRKKLLQSPFMVFEDICVVLKGKDQIYRTNGTVTRQRPVFGITFPTGTTQTPTTTAN